MSLVVMTGTFEGALQQTHTPIRSSTDRGDQPGTARGDVGPRIHANSARYAGSSIPDQRAPPTWVRPVGDAGSGVPWPLGLRATLSDIGQTVAENYGTKIANGVSFLEQLTP